MRSVGVLSLRRPKDFDKQPTSNQTQNSESHAREKAVTYGCSLPFSRLTKPFSVRALRHLGDLNKTSLIFDIGGLAFVKDQIFTKITTIPYHRNTAAPGHRNRSVNVIAKRILKLVPVGGQADAGLHHRFQEKLTSVRRTMVIGRKIEMQNASQANRIKEKKNSDTHINEEQR